MDRGTWQAIVHEVTESDTTEHKHTLEEKDKILEKRKLFIFAAFMYRMDRENRGMGNVQSRELVARV